MSARPAPGSEGDAVRVRAMRADDLPAVVEIESLSFRTPWSEQTFRNLLRRSNACLIVAENAAGFVLGYAVTWFAGAECELGDLAVDPSVRRRGIGSRLLGVLLEDAGRRGAASVFLEVRMSNIEAQHLYERWGFRPVGTRPGYYASPLEDALVMRRAVDYAD